MSDKGHGKEEGDKGKMGKMVAGVLLFIVLIYSRALNELATLVKEFLIDLSIGVSAIAGTLLGSFRQFGNTFTSQGTLLMFIVAGVLFALYKKHKKAEDGEAGHGAKPDAKPKEEKSEAKKDAHPEPHK